MFPPAQGLRLDIDAISQIFGSISIACWIGLHPVTIASALSSVLANTIAVVFSPQIIENWKRSSAEGLSVVFIIIWLLGDFFNIIGAVLQGVLPTMIILAVYYTLADIVLLLQCFWYKGFTLRDDFKKPMTESDEDSEASEQSPLLAERRPHSNGSPYTNRNGNGIEVQRSTIPDFERRGSGHSQSSFRERYLSIDGTHLSPVTPLLDDPTTRRRSSVVAVSPAPAQSNLQTIIFNAGTVLLVCAAGVFGWYLSARNAPPSDGHDPSSEATLHFNLWGQISGYVCAILYLGSRVPQLLLNYRRKSTEGISMLFFLFACLGNLTYVLSILVYKPKCGGHECRGSEGRAEYGKYIAVNMSWLLGSFGTLLLDAGVFVQYFMYRTDDEESSDEEE
ncbi:putative vacuolar amino acid transporter YPQ3 [Curvularia clavata]|uniref:Vacuolar amino acid transporter YPQ3 n=1 Tax=Curvularia clavata TaxID=95742 RepID=A0A9Q9DP74_CURCL|nr:putative vacuolar amino acid transporter YPQ3 [Curvularia clavata]